MSTSAPATAITASLRDLNAWAAHFREAEIPICAETSEALEALRANEDAVDANSLGEMIAGDPLMTLKVLAHASIHRSARAVTDVETVISALVMMGISPFFRAFGQQKSVEASLANQPEAFRGLTQTVLRAHRGASFALGFAVHRMDHDAAVIHTAALLHDFAEMLLWCHAPLLALRIRDLQQADAALRSSAAQLGVLGIELADLQQALMKGWRLPELLIRISDDRHVGSAGVQNVTLAVRLARHTAEGWSNPAIPDDIEAISELLNLSHSATLRFVREI
jgi:HD-like signal output (HDOD) protein